jgi:DNA-binding GntR family transcriptional regulator
MHRAIDGMAAATTEPDYMRHDTDFHIAVARATGNAIMTRAIEDIRMRLNDAMTLLPESEAWHQRISGEHEELLVAIEGGDAQTAETLMQEHVANTSRVCAQCSRIRRRGMWK